MRRLRQLSIARQGFFRSQRYRSGIAEFLKAQRSSQLANVGEFLDLPHHGFDFAGAVVTDRGPSETAKFTRQRIVRKRIAGTTIRIFDHSFELAAILHLDRDLGGSQARIGLLTFFIHRSTDVGHMTDNTFFPA